MKRYLVTGGAGFIGSHVVDALLLSGARVRVVDDLSTGHVHNLDPRAELVVGDVADPSLIGDAVSDVDGIIHLAAIASVNRSNVDWLGTHRANQTATVSVLDAARNRGGIPVVYASSAAVYGDVSTMPISENTKTQPRSAYGVDKLGSELHAFVAALVHNVPSVGLRFFNVYGPRQDPSSPYSGVISIFARRIIDSAPITIHGNGGQTRDFVFVADVVDHVLAALALLEAQEVSSSYIANVCTGRPTTIMSLAQAMFSVSDRTVPLIYEESRPGDIRDSVGDPTLATSLLGVRAGVEIKAGLAATMGASLQV